MNINNHNCHGGPNDGCRVTCGASVPHMPDTVCLQQKPNEDGFQPWSNEPSERFPAVYQREPFTWGDYHFAGWHTTIPPEPPGQGETK